MCRRLFPLTLLAGLLCSAHSAFPYYGKLIQSGWGSRATHRLAGDIYSIDENRFQVINFSFDGLGPDAAFLLGTRQMYDTVRSGSGIDTSAVVLANPVGQTGGLRRYSGEKVVLHLPAGRVLTDFTYIAVGNRQSKRLYGGARIPRRFVPPAPRVIGTFRTRAHRVASGPVTVLNDRMIKIEGFRYDGQGPDAFFYVGVTNNVATQAPPYGKIPDENGVSNRKARAYNDKDIVLTLPDTISATDLKWLSMWCISFAHNFGEVTFPSGLSVPPYVPTTVQQSQEMNCEPLSDNLQVSWLVSGGTITIELAGNIDRNTDYMAFGLSGSDSSFSMIGADVVVADFKENRAPRAVDYFLTAYAQCAINGGACPDTSTFNSGRNDVRMPTGKITNGIVRIKYKRALVTNDGNRDKVYKVDGTPQQIVWAIGPLNTVGEAAKHYPTNGRISTAKTINFGRRTMDNCPTFNTQEESAEVPFKPHHLYGRPGKTVFTADIGQSGSTQGYMAITGRPSWGIAWYINGILIPELHLRRGITYTFRVAGGSNPAIGAKYHPLYFTDSVEGGFSQTGNGTIYPGLINGVRRNFATGDYCEWKFTNAALDAADAGYRYQCFEEFKADLSLECDANPASYTEFKFTPGASTPDLLYYQRRVPIPNRGGKKIARMRRKEMRKRLKAQRARQRMRAAANRMSG